jgi:molybdopterin adenylyltransferase
VTTSDAQNPATDTPSDRKPLSAKKITVAIVTISDRAYQGIYKDKSGPAVAEAFDAETYDIVETKIISDNPQMISDELIRLADRQKVDVIVTTGSTGCSTRDVAPEATTKILHKVVPGIAETIRLANRDKNPNLILSRGTSGLRNNTLIINLPGNPESAKLSIETILPAVPHCIKTMQSQKPMFKKPSGDKKNPSPSQANYNTKMAEAFKKSGVGFVKPK